MKARSLVLALWVAFSWPAAGRAQAPWLDTLLQQTSNYISTFVDGLSNVVAEEEYLQQYRNAAPRRRLRSDFLLVRYPGQDRLMLTFRDVLEVNGRPVVDQQERLLKLFLEPFADAVRRAGEIQRDGLRHSLTDRGARLADPLYAIAFLQGAYQENFVFTLGGYDRGMGSDVREVRFVRKDLPPRGVGEELTAWIEEGTGRVRRTQVRAGRGANSRLMLTTFARDEALAIDVPVEMRDLIPVANGDEFTGTATYRNFRRFQVRASEAIETPAPSPR